jgi:hypothetical protein
MLRRAIIVGLGFFGLLWLLITGYGLACFFSRDVHGLGKIVWIVGSFWLGIYLSIPLLVVVYRKGVRWRIAASVPAIVSVCAMALSFVVSPPVREPTQISFNSEEWRKNADNRNGTVRDLIAHHLSTAMKSADVEALLGPPNESYTSAELSNPRPREAMVFFYYNMKPCEGCLDYTNFIVSFGTDGRYRNAVVVDK